MDVEGKLGPREKRTLFIIAYFMLGQLNIGFFLSNMFIPGLMALAMVFVVGLYDLEREKRWL